MTIATCREESPRVFVCAESWRVGCPLVRFQAGQAGDREPARVIGNDYGYLAVAQPSSYNDHRELSRIFEP